MHSFGGLFDRFRRPQKLNLVSHTVVFIVSNISINRVTPSYAGIHGTEPTGPGPRQFRKSRTKSDWSVPGPGSPWIPIPIIIINGCNIIFKWPMNSRIGLTRLSLLKYFSSSSDEIAIF